MSQAIALAGPNDFFRQAQALLPRGDAWPRDPSSDLSALLQACLASLARVHALAADLTEIESFPPTSEALLPDWEQAYGLPDPCSPINASTGQRQAAVAARIAASGGQSKSYFIGVAQALGFPITIETFAPATFGNTSFGEPIYGVPWIFAWQVNAPTLSENFALFGGATFGDPFATYSNTQLGCVLNRLKPAYSTLIMNYA
jgi:uncharacterized protein YmfQ (DUF2313 family)